MKTKKMIAGLAAVSLLFVECGRYLTENTDYFEWLS